MDLINISTILMFIIALILTMALWIFLQSKRPFAIWGRKGTMIFKLDPITRNVLPYKLDQLYENKSKVSSWIKPNYKSHTSNILKLFGLMNNNAQGNKLYRQALHDIGNGQEEIRYSFIARNMRIGTEFNRINFEVLMRKIVDVSDYLIIVNWRVITKQESNFELVKLSTIDQIVQKKANFKGFITFDLNQKVPFVQDKFLKELSPIFKTKKYDVFLWTNLTIVVCYAKNYKKIKKLTTSFAKYVELKKRKIGLSQFINGSGSARFQNIHTKKDMNKALATLHFISNLSLKWNEPFVDLRTAQNFKPEFITFNDASRKFRDLIRSHQFQERLVPIKSRKTQRKVMDYIVINLNSFDQYEIKNILLSAFSQKELINANIEKFLSKEVSEPVLIDVNASWLITNFNKLKLGKNFYVVKLDDYSFLDQIITIIQELKAKDFAIGLRVSDLCQFSITLIEKIKPVLVVIDQKVIEENNFSNILHYTKLLSFKNIFEHQNIKVIFENLSPQITNEIATHLGINFYYNL